MFDGTVFFHSCVRIFKDLRPCRRPQKYIEICVFIDLGINIISHKNYIMWTVRFIFISWNVDNTWTVRSIFSGLLTYTHGPPNANFQNLEILNFQFSSISAFLGHICEVMSFQICAYVLYGPCGASLKLVLIC